MESGALILNILSPEKEIFNGNVSRVTLPGKAGSFTILPNHAPIVSSLKAGLITYLSADKEESLEIKGGFIEMSEGKVSVCIY